jgi:hypothetical protein
MKKDNKITAPESPGVRPWVHHSGDDKAAWQKSMQGTQLPDALRSFLQLMLQKVFGLTLEFRQQ